MRCVQLNSLKPTQKKKKKRLNPVSISIGSARKLYCYF